LSVGLIIAHFTLSGYANKNTAVNKQAKPL